MNTIKKSYRLLPENDAKAKRRVKEEQKTKTKYSENQYINDLIANDKN